MLRFFTVSRLALNTNLIFEIDSNISILSVALPQIARSGDSSFDTITLRPYCLSISFGINDTA